MERRPVFDTQRRIWRTVSYFGALASAAALTPVNAFARPQTRQSTQFCRAPKISNVGFQLKDGPGQEFDINLSFDMNTHHRSGDLSILVNGIEENGTGYVFSYETHYSDRVAFGDWDRPHATEYDTLVDLRTDCGEYYRPFIFNLPPRSDECSDTYVIDMHGSGSSAYEVDPPGNAFAAALVNNLPKKHKISEIAVPFAAAGSLASLVRAKEGLPGPYTDSVKRMEKWLPEQITRLRKACKMAKILVAGYSQGAQAAGDAYQNQNGNNINGLVLFGDPKYNHKDSSDRFGLNDTKEKDRRTNNNGALGKRPAFNSSRVFSYCHRGDPVCQGIGRLLHWDQHKNYSDFKEPMLAAKHMARFVG